VAGGGRSGGPPRRAFFFFFLSFPPWRGSRTSKWTMEKVVLLMGMQGKAAAMCQTPQWCDNELGSNRACPGSNPGPHQTTLTRTLFFFVLSIYESMRMDGFAASA
jgi:hypothetical protein